MTVAADVRRAAVPGRDRRDVALPGHGELAAGLVEAADPWHVGGRVAPMCRRSTRWRASPYRLTWSKTAVAWVGPPPRGAAAERYGA